MENVQVTVTGRNVEIPEHFRGRIDEKLPRATKYDPSLTHVDVELKHEPNPRRSEEDSRVQITAQGAGHLARAESKADNFYAALEEAIEKLERSLRKVKVRREIARSGHRTPKSTGEIARELVDQAQALREEQPEEPYVDNYAQDVDFYEPGQVVREKELSGEKMTVDDALSNMEYVGHDFYLFVNSENNKPSLVYRRHAFDYGLITLNMQ